MAQVLFNNSYQPYPTNIDKFLERIVSEDNLNSFIIVLPTQKLVRYFKQKLIRKYYDEHKRPISNINIFNLKNFIENCYDRIFNDRYKYQISESYKILLFEEAIENAQLSFYNNEKGLSKALIEKLANVVYGLKEDGITIENLEEELNFHDVEEFEYYDKKRLKDILSIYKEYERLLEDKYLDDISIIQKIIKKFNNQKDIDYISNIYPEITSIFLFGFTEFKVPEYQLLSHFANTKISMSIIVDYSILNGPIFGNLERTIEHFLASGFKLTENEDKYKGIKETDLIESNYNFERFKLNREVYLRKWLFNHYFDLKTNEFNDLITIMGCQDKQDEVETIAKLVKYYILEKNISPGDICIVSRKAESYSELFREMFSLYQIPYNVSDRFNLNRSPVIISLISFLNVIIYGFRFDDFTKALNNRFISFKDIDKDNLFNVANNLRIIGGRIRGGYVYWQNIIKAKIESIKKLLLKFEDYSDDYIEKKSYENDKKNYEKAYRDLNIIIDNIPQIPNRMTFEDFINIIEIDIIGKFQIKEKIEKSLEDFIHKRNRKSNFDDLVILEGIEKEARAIKSFENLINEISRIHTARYGNKSYPVEVILDKIKTAIESTKFQVKEKQHYGANITSIEQSRGIPYKLMILCGANDGDFPLKYRTDTIVGKELKDSFKKHLKSERLLFYQFLTNNPDALNDGTKEIYITYPKYESDEYLVRSSFIDALLKITSLNEAGKVITNDLLESNKNAYKNKFPWFFSFAKLNSLFDVTVKNNNFKLLENYIQDENLNHFNQKIINLTTERQLDNINLIKQKLDTFLNKPFSISRIESYIKCPFKFLMETIFHLQEEEQEIDFGISPLTMGNILHKVLKTFYENQKNEILNKKSYEYKIVPTRDDLDIIVPIDLIPDLKDRYLEQLKSIYFDLEQTIRIEHPYFDIDSNRILGNDGRPGLLELWLDRELDRIKNGWLTKPVLFELDFGINQFSQIKPISIEDNQFRGKIDRIELYKNNDDYFFLIADYKLSFKDEHTNKEIKKLTSFQMPVYISATQQILRQYYNIDAKAIGGIYYYLTLTKKNSKLIPYQSVLIEKKSVLNEIIKNSKDLLSEDEIQEIMNNVFSKINEIKRSINNLDFEIRPLDNKVCKYCNFGAICKVKQRELK